MKTPDEIAEGIVTNHVRRAVVGWHSTQEDGERAVERIEASVSAAIQAERDARPPKGHVITDDGVIRKVLGELPTTKDGCVVGDGARLWTQNAGETNCLPVDCIGATEFGEDGDFYPAEECYSTRQAAEAAAKEKA